MAWELPVFKRDGPGIVGRSGLDGASVHCDVQACGGYERTARYVGGHFALIETLLFLGLGLWMAKNLRYE